MVVITAGIQIDGDEAVLSDLMDVVEPPSNIRLPFVKRASHHCLRYMDGYRAGLVGPELDYTVTKYNGHSMISRENFAIVQSEFKKKQEDQLQSSFKKC